MLRGGRAITRSCVIGFARMKPAGRNEGLLEAESSPRRARPLSTHFLFGCCSLGVLTNAARCPFSTHARFFGFGPMKRRHVGARARESRIHPKPRKCSRATSSSAPSSSPSSIDRSPGDAALIILFGLPASGKNHVGMILEKRFGFVFHDGDDDLPEDMRRTIEKKEVATQAMRDAHIENIIKSINELRREGSNRRVAVAAALFKEDNRAKLKAKFPSMKLMWVRAADATLHSRLKSRQNHLACSNYAAKIFEHFEIPKSVDAEILNSLDNNDDHVINQLHKHV